MIDRKNIEQYLALNGLPSDAPEEEVRALLKSANWNTPDIDFAIKLLNATPEEIVKLNKELRPNYYNTDQRLSPDTMNSLLGMEVTFDRDISEHKRMLETIYRSQLVSIAVLSFFCAFLFLMIGMWYLQVGFFHEDAIGFRR